MLKLITTRRMDELGRVVLPAEVRSALDWKTEIFLDIYCDTDTGRVYLKAHENTCIHCGSTQNLLGFKNRYICSKCQKEIMTLSDESCRSIL